MFHDRTDEYDARVDAKRQTTGSAMQGEGRLEATLQDIVQSHCACDVMRGYTCGIHARVAAVRAALASQESTPRTLDNILREKESTVAEHIKAAALDGCQCEPCLAAMNVAVRSVEQKSTPGLSHCNLEFTLSQATALLEMFGGDDTLISVTRHEGVLKAWNTEYPDEGSMILGDAAGTYKCPKCGLDYPHIHEQNGSVTRRWR